MGSRTVSESQTGVTAFEAARIKLIRWGIVMIGIYMIYVLFFPLTPTIYRSDHILEIEQMLREGRKWFAAFYGIGLGLLFYAFWRIMNIVHSLSQEDVEAAKSLRAWVLGIGIFSGMVLVGLYPITALDVALYVVRARLWAFYGGSPMLAVPADFPQDPYIGLAGEYDREVSPYGPAWELIAQVPIRLGLFEIGSGILAMKVISLLAYIGMAVLIGWYARQDSPKYKVSGLTAMTFFAINPLVLMEAIGNGHNDMVMLALMTLGLVLWQRDQWRWATLALTLATLIKITGLILMPLFGIAVLVAAPNWRARVLRGLTMAAIFLVTAGIAYRLTGPFPEVFLGAQHVMFDRWGYTPVYMLRVIGRVLSPPGATVTSVIVNLSRGVFILYYAHLMVRIAQGKMTLAQAGFLAYFSLLLLGTTFRIWYPLWLIPFAAMRLNSLTYWRTFLFGITAELSILLYLVVWRWKLDTWDWGLSGPLAEYWTFWIVMTFLIAPWVFGIPILIPALLQRKDPERFENSLWIGRSKPAVSYSRSAGYNER
jgi:hypothetical protein